MADKIIASDNPKVAAAKSGDGPSPAQLEALKRGDLKPLDSAKDVGLPGLEIHNGVTKVGNLDGSQVVFSQDAGGSTQLHSIRTFDGHTASPVYAEDGSVNKLTIQSRGEEPYSLTKSSDAKFDWVDSRTGESSRMVIEAHAGENPGKTGEIAMYEEATGKATLFAPEGATQPETALKDFRFLFGRSDGYPYGSGNALPFKSDAGANVSIFDPAYRGIPTVTEIPQHHNLSAQAEIMHIKTDDGRGVGLKFDAAKSGTDGRPLITSAAVSDADGNSFELKRIGDTNQWRDSSTGALRNLEIERAVGNNAATSAEILIKDLDDVSKNLFFSPHGKSPLLTDKIHKLYKDALPELSTELNRGISYAEVEHAGVGFIKSAGGKIALGAAAAGALYAAGDWIYSKLKGVEKPETLDFSAATLDSRLRSYSGENQLKSQYKTLASEEFKILEK